MTSQTTLTLLHKEAQKRVFLQGTVPIRRTNDHAQDNLRCLNFPVFHACLSVFIHKITFLSLLLKKFVEKLTVKTNHLRYFKAVLSSLFMYSIFLNILEKLRPNLKFFVKIYS